MNIQQLNSDPRRVLLCSAALTLALSSALHAAPPDARPDLHKMPELLAGTSFSLGPCVVSEGQSGTTACNFVVTLANPATEPLQLSYQTDSPGNLLAPGSDSSLETPLIGAESGIFGTGSSLGAWLVENGNVELKSWMQWQAAHYRQSLDMHGDTAGTIGRDLATAPGQRYLVSFALASHPVCVNTVSTLSVSFGAQDLGSFSFNSTGSSISNMRWRYESVEVTASDALARLRFASTTPGGCGPAVDDLAVTPPGSASSGIDFAPASRHHEDPLVLAAGTSTYTVAVDVIGDSIVEGFEDFELQVCIGGLGCQTAIGGINDDEGPADLVFQNGFE